MMQTITKLNIAPTEPAKEYFTAIDRRDKLAFLEKPQMSWQETLDYLQNYWNAGNIQGLCTHLSKPLRRRYCGNAAAIMSTVSYMDTLLLQNKKIIWHNTYAEQTEGIVRIELLDRKMCRWQLDSYG